MTDGPGWTEERTQQVKNLWTEGLSASRIARIIGGISRNAVIGKVHRLGLPGREISSREYRPRLPSSTRVSMRARQPEPEPVIEEPPLVLHDGTHVTILTIDDRMCRWPIGNPDENEFHFCGRKPKGGHPYCEAHARKAYQPKHAPTRGPVPDRYSVVTHR